MSDFSNQFSTTLPQRPTKSKLPPARFALLMKNTQDYGTVETAIQADFAGLRIEISPFSANDPQMLILTFPDRLMTSDDAAAFELSYRLIDRLGLQNGDPEIFTDLMPERSATPSPKPGTEKESVDDLIPGCWVPADPAIDEDTEWALAAMKVKEAWTVSSNNGRPAQGENVVIAQIDTGITGHPVLANVAFLPGHDFINRQPGFDDPMDYAGHPGHGTATSSVIVSPLPGKVCGVAPKAILMPLRAIESVVRISQVAVAEAIDHAVANGAHVITMSLGGLPSVSLWRAINRAVRANVIVLAAAGNCVGLVVFPARYEGCLAIGATNKQNSAWQGSCSGPDVDVSAPGENVYAARADRKPADAPIGFSTAQSQGTSFAVAITAGVAALWLSHHGRDTLIAHASQRSETLQAMFRRLVRASSMRPGPHWDATEMGSGIVDAQNLLNADLDLGRDRESLGIAYIGTTADAVKRLVLETTRSAAAAQAPIDWERYGPEIAYSLMTRQRLGGQDAPARQGSGEATMASPPAVLSNRLNQLLDSSAPLAQVLRRS